MNDAKLGNWYCTAAGQMMGGIVSLMIEDHDWDKHFLSFFFPSLHARHLIYYFCSQMAANLDEIATAVVIHSAPASGYRKVLRFSISTLDSWSCNIQQLSFSWLFFTWHFSSRHFLLFYIILEYFFNNIFSLHHFISFFKIIFDNIIHWIKYLIIVW